MLFHRRGLLWLSLAVRYTPKTVFLYPRSIKLNMPMGSILIILGNAEMVNVHIDGLGYIRGAPLKEENIPVYSTW